MTRPDPIYLYRVDFYRHGNSQTIAGTPREQVRSFYKEWNIFCPGLFFSSFLFDGRFHFPVPCLSCCLNFLAGIDRVLRNVTVGNFTGSSYIFFSWWFSKSLVRRGSQSRPVVFLVPCGFRPYNNQIESGGMCRKLTVRWSLSFFVLRKW